MTDSKCQVLIDKQEITEVLIRYCRGVDRADEELLRSVYHHDSSDDHGSFKGSGPDFVSWVIPRLRASSAITHHVISNVLIDLEGDVADAETYFVSYRAGRDDPDQKLEILGGRYVDRLERREGAWRIYWRVTVCDWAHVTRSTDPFPGRDAFVVGRHDQTDVSYRI